MKKLIFTSVLAAVAGVSSLSAQSRIDNSNDKKHQAANQVSMPSEKQATKLGKVDQISDWYSPYDWAGKAGAEPFFKNFVQFIMPDSITKYIDDGDTISRFYNISVGQVMDPKDDNIDQTTNPGLKLSKYTGYTVDSIALAYLYVRNISEKNDGNGNMVPVKDTLIINYYTVANNGIKKGKIGTEVTALVDWNKATLSPIGFLGQQKIVLDENDSTSALNKDNGYENAWLTDVKTIGVDIPNGLVLPSKGVQDNIVAFTVKFKPGHAYDSNSVIIYQKDPATLPSINTRSNYFGYRFFSNDGTPEQQINQTTYYNNSLISSKDAAYVTANNNGWVGYVAGNAYFKTQYVQCDFHLTTLNAGLKDIKNDNFAMTNVYPNPASVNSTAVMGFNLKSSATVTVNIFNIAGQLEKTAINKNFAAGEHAEEFSLTGLKAGIYLVNMTVNGVSQTKKLTITE